MDDDEKVSERSGDGFGRVPGVAGDRIAVLEHRVRSGSDLALGSCARRERLLPLGMQEVNGG